MYALVFPALGAFRGILGAALGVQKMILGMRNPILGMASHDLCNAKNQNSRSNSRSDSRNSWEPMKDLHFPLRFQSFLAKIARKNNPENPRVPQKV